MKKILSLAVLALAGLICAQAAEPAYEYVPFVREGVVWNCYYYNGVEDFYSYEMKGDSVVNGVTYKKCYKYTTEEQDVNNAEVVALLRESDKKVYRYVDPLSVGTWAIRPYLLHNGDNERIIYDFNDVPNSYRQRGDTTKIFVINGAKDQIQIGNTLRNRYNALDEEYTFLEEESETPYIIEGIGYASKTAGDPLIPFRLQPTDGSAMGLISVIEDGRKVYDGLTQSAVTTILSDEQRTGDGRYYDLTGRPVAAPAAPGIYIHNGKKVLVR